MPTRESETQHRYLEEAVRLILKAVVPISLLFGGLALLYLRLPGWSIIFGLPLVVFGTVFLIYTYDEVVSQKIGRDDNP